MKLHFKYRLLLAIAVIFLSEIILSSRVNAAGFERNRLAYIDPATQSIIFQSYDKKHSSSYTYKTIGVTVARCTKGTGERHPSGEYVILPFSGSQIGGTVVDNGNGYITSTYVISKEVLYKEIQSSHLDWYAELQDDSIDQWMYVDCIMACYEGNTPKGRFIGAVPVQNTYWNTIDSHNVSNGGSYPALEQGWASTSMFNAKGSKIDILNVNTVRKDGSNTLTTMGAKPWSGGTKAGFRTHIDIKIKFSGTPEAPAIPSNYVAKTGKLKPDYYTWNSGTDRDGDGYVDYLIGTSIPSGEEIYNGVGADTWYGDMTIGYHEETKTYPVTYNFRYYTKRRVPKYKTVKGQRVSDGYDIVTEWHDSIRNFKVVRKAGYYFLMDANVYELLNIDVYNEVYPNMKLNYQYPGNTIPVTVLHDNVDLANGGKFTNRDTDPTTHIVWPAAPGVITINCGEGIGSANVKSAAINKAIHDNTYDGNDPVGQVESWNDLYMVDGVKYLDNAHVAGIDTTTTAIKWKTMDSSKNATESSPYRFKETVHEPFLIPIERPNDAYGTEMELTYIKRAQSDGSTQFITCYGDNILQHIKDKKFPE